MLEHIKVDENDKPEIETIISSLTKSEGHLGAIAAVFTMLIDGPAEKIEIEILSELLKSQADKIKIAEEAIDLVLLKFDFGVNSFDTLFTHRQVFSRLFVPELFETLSRNNQITVYSYYEDFFTQHRELFKNIRIELQDILNKILLNESLEGNAPTKA